MNSRAMSRLVAAPAPHVGPWDTFCVESPGEMRAQMYATSRQPVRSCRREQTPWYTTNSEYGRSHRLKRHLSGSNALQEEPPQDNKKECSVSKSSTTKLPPIDAKYIPSAPKSNNKPDMTVLPGKQRLTTGFSKRWMQAECGRFYGNIREVAPAAGFDIASRKTGESQVLTVNHEDNMRVYEREDDEYSHSLPSPASVASQDLPPELTSPEPPEVHPVCI